MATSTIQMKGSDPEYTTVTYTQCRPTKQYDSAPITGIGLYTSVAESGNQVLVLGIAKSGYTPVGIESSVNIVSKGSSSGSYIEFDYWWSNYAISGNTLVLTASRSNKWAYREGSHGSGALYTPTVGEIKIKYVKN